jgi:hypothetical protein
MAKHNPAPQSATKQAKVRTLKTIPVEVQEELLAFGILRNRLDQMHAALASRQDSIIEKLIGRKMNAALIRDLAAEHNRRAAKLAR